VFPRRRSHAPPNRRHRSSRCPITPPCCERGPGHASDGRSPRLVSPIRRLDVPGNSGSLPRPCLVSPDIRTDVLESRGIAPRHRHELPACGLVIPERYPGALGRGFEFPRRWRSAPGFREISSGSRGIFPLHGCEAPGRCGAGQGGRGWCPGLGAGSAGERGGAPGRGLFVPELRRDGTGRCGAVSGRYDGFPGATGCVSARRRSARAD
jgi:hypothetical protein